jgi:serine-type D-Ala-D-Ala carboxypeptidase/endopeptidase
LFDIGFITKTFTTLLLADMVERGMVNLTDLIEKYLPSSVKVPEFKGQTKDRLEYTHE